MSKKLFELAEEFKMSSAAMMQMLKSIGIPVKSHMSTVDEELRGLIKEKFEQERAQIKKAYERKRSDLNHFPTEEKRMKFIVDEKTGLCLDHIVGGKRAAVRDFLRIGTTSGDNLCVVDASDLNEVLQISSDPVLGSGFSDTTVQAAVARAFYCNSVWRCLSSKGDKGVIVKIVTGVPMTLGDLKKIAQIVEETAGDSAIFYYGFTFVPEMKNATEAAVLAAVRPLAA